MAKKKTSAIRIFQLAKELGVSSKDLVAKCQAESIPDITNHMSAVSMGLAATIREWFGNAEATVATAVETAAPVDVEAARAKAKKKKKVSRAKTATRKKTATASGTDEADSDTAVAVMDGPEIVPPSQPAAAPRETIAPAAKAPTIEKKQDDEAPPTAPPEEAETAAPVMNVPDRPKVIAPAGPKLEQPTATKLTGPKVIRVESPDVLPPPQPRRSPRDQPGGGRGKVGTGRGVDPYIGADGPGVDAPIRGRGADGGAGASSRRNKRRSSTSRPETGRSGRALSDTDRSFNWREQDLRERELRLNRASGFLRAARRDNQKRTAGPGHRAQSAAEAGGVVRVEEPITLKSLSAITGVRVNDMIRNLVKSGEMLTTPDQIIAGEKAQEIMLEFGIDLEVVEQMTAEEQIAEQFKEREVKDGRSRSPVVTILGHVDHGKTTLLDSIRQTNVAEGEAGGITQATSAFRVSVKVGDDEHMITFIDTPGHEAFTEMRARGAKVTDIVVLVVAADDGVMPQTEESISHAKAASVPIIVALNKVDKPEATDSNVQRILGQLAEQELNPVEWGGSTEVVRISALKNEGIQELLELIDYQAQLLELTADFKGRAEGTVIESQLEEGRGAVARVLVQQGQLHKGDYIVAGRAFGRVRDIVNDRGERIKDAAPCMPVAVSGINEVPDAGDRFFIVKNLREAEAAADERKQQERERSLAKEKVTLDNIFEKLSESGRKELPLVVKADVQGSLETLRAVIGRIGSDEVVVAIKHSAIGGINESDISLADASGAIVIGFNVTTSGAARRQAEAKSVDIRLYDVIYDLTDDVKKAAEGLLEPELKLEVLGHAEVREVFKISKIGMIAGCYVTEGNIERNAQIRVTREGIVVEKDRRLEQLKRFKDDVKTVNAGQECGMRIDGYDDIHVGDVLECYKTMQVQRSL